MSAASEPVAVPTELCFSKRAYRNVVQIIVISVRVLVSPVNRITTELTHDSPRFDRLAFALAAFAALLVFAVLVANAVAAGMGGVLVGAFGLAVGVALVAALPFLVVRAVSDATLR